MGAHRQGNLARQPEAGAAIGNPDELLTEASVGQLLTVLSAGEIVGSIGMGVIDMGKGQKAMQERLNRGARATGLKEAVHEVINHFSVAQALTVEQKQEVVQAQTSKRSFCAGRQVRA